MLSAPFGSATSSLKERRPRSQRANKPTSQRTAWPRPAADACQVQKERVLRCVECLVWTNLKKLTFLLDLFAQAKRFLQFWVSKRTCMKQFRLVNCQLIETKLTLRQSIRCDLRLKHCSGGSAVPRLQSTSSTTTGFVDVLCHEPFKNSPICSFLVGVP